MGQVIAVASASGDLEGRIARHLIAQGAAVRALVRPQTPAPGKAALTEIGATVAPVNFDDVDSVASACQGASCVVSAVSTPLGQRWMTITPRILRIAGDTQSVRDIASVMSEATGHRYRTVKIGSVPALGGLAAIVRQLTPESPAAFPPWQGMQYMRDQFSGDARLIGLDNDRYPGVTWTTVRDAFVRDHQPLHN